MFEDVHERLAGVLIECLPYGEFIKRYDRKTTLYYLDPPYFNSEKDYGKDMFSPDDFERLARLLSVIKGRFIMSLNDVPQVHEIFADFTIEAVNTTYGLSAGVQTSAKVVIISN